MLLRALLCYILLLIGFFITIPNLLMVKAQSCGNHYGLVNSYSCPTDKGNNSPCVSAANCRSCTGNGIGCYVFITGDNLTCQFGAPHSAGFGKRTCSLTYPDPQYVFGGIACNACPYSSWSDIAGCGQNGCGPTDKQQRRTSSTCGSSVCQPQYRCTTNTTYCIAPSVPTVTASSCSSPSNSSTAAWSSSSGATYYALRINKTSVAWDGLCSTPGNPNGGNFCENVTGTSKTFTGEAGQTYNWWVHACNANNQCSAAVYSSFTCPPPPVSGSCGATLNSCTAGTFSDKPDSPTQYLWDCVGSNGGSTASCSQDIPPPPSPSPYFKLKDTSFYKQGFLSSNFPASYSCPASRYDNSDICIGGYFNQGEAGMVVVTGNSLSAGAGGTSISGSQGEARNWTSLNYQSGNTFTASSFVNYVKAKKKSTPVIDLSDIPSSGVGGIYSLPTGNLTVFPSTSIAASYVTIIVNGDLTLSTADLGQDGIVFVVIGDVTINGDGAPVKFNGANRPFALISSGAITFANSLVEADGLYVASSVDFGTGANPLKIVGNIVSSSAASFGRDRGTSAPSMFVVFDPRHMLGVLDKVSVVKSSWTQAQ